MGSRRTSIFENGLIWFGAGVSLAEILTGTSFAPLGFTKGLLAIIIGHIIGCGMMFFAGFIGGKTRKSAMETVKMSFGSTGALLFAVLNILQLVGWTAIMIYDGSLAAAGDDFLKYMFTGGLHLYNKNYKAKDHWVKIKVADPGLFAIAAIAENESKIPLYDATKKKVLKKDINGGSDDFSTAVKAGDEFYVKLPTKISKVFILTGVIKSEFGSMANDKSYYEIGKGTTTYHPFSISKRSIVYLEVTSVEKKSEKISMYIEKNVNGTWQRVGYSANIKPLEYGTTLGYGLQPGQYRMALKNPKDNIINVEYQRTTINKNVAYKKTKALNIKKRALNVYTTEEHTARWYKVSVSSTKKRTELLLSKYSVGGGFQFKVYQKGKVIKTVKVKKDEDGKYVTLPKKKGTYYIKVSKLTDKTTGVYEIETDKE